MLAPSFQDIVIVHGREFRDSRGVWCYGDL